jgi:hypothetical protein
VKTWSDLYVAHRTIRSIDGRWRQAIRSRLGKLAQAGHCDEGVRSRFSDQKDDKHKRLRRYSFRRDGADVAEPLTKLDHLRAARLSILGLVDTKREHLCMFTVMVEGQREDGSAWTLAVHLPDDRETEQNPSGDRQGLGACSHAVLHCHVGPDLDTGPKVRVPLPALGPVDALDWVLSQLVPTPQFELAPWAEVQAAIKKASA